MALIALLALSGVFASPARAECDDVRWELRNQWNPFGGGLSLVRVPVCHDFSSPATKPHKKQRKKAARKPTRKQLRALRFDPSPVISADVRERLLDELVGDAVGESADKAREIITSGNLLAQFHASVREQQPDWSTRDLGDMFTFAYLQLWLTANEKSRISAPVGKAVRKDLRSQLALDRDLARTGDAAQQERAEWIASMTVALIGSVNAASATGVPVSVEANLDYLRERVDDFDLFRTDLTRIRLTKRGIARR